MYSQRVARDLEKQYEDLHTTKELYSFDLSEIILSIQSQFNTLFLNDIIDGSYTYSEGLYFKGTNELLISNTHPNYKEVLEIVDGIAKGTTKLHHIWLSDGGYIPPNALMYPKERLSVIPGYSPIAAAFTRLYIDKIVTTHLAYGRSGYDGISKDKALLESLGLYPVLSQVINPGELGTGIFEWVLDPCVLADSYANAPRVSAEYRALIGDEAYSKLISRIRNADDRVLASDMIRFINFDIDSKFDVLFTDIYIPVSKDPWAMYSLDFRGGEFYLHKQGDYRAMEWVVSKIDQLNESLDKAHEEGIIITPIALNMVSHKCYQDAVVEKIHKLFDGTPLEGGSMKTIRDKVERQYYNTSKTSLSDIDSIREYSKVKEEHHYLL